MSQQTLVEIGDDAIAILELIDQLEDGELSPEDEKALDALCAEVFANRDRKLDSYCAIIEELDRRHKARAAACERLAKRARIDEDRRDWLKERLKTFFITQGLKKVATERYNITLAGNGGVQPMDTDQDKLPPEYIKTTTVIGVDNVKIREDLAAGKEIPGVTLRERGKQIKIT